MPEFSPLAFHAYDFSRKELAADLVAAPPYDVVSSIEREELSTRSPYNVTHLDLPKSYAEAARLLERWRAEGVIKPLPADGYYLLASDFLVDEENTGATASSAVSIWLPGGRRASIPTRRPIPRPSRTAWS